MIKIPIGILKKGLLKALDQGGELVFSFGSFKDLSKRILTAEKKKGVES